MRSSVQDALHFRICASEKPRPLKSIVLVVLLIPIFCLLTGMAYAQTLTVTNKQDGTVIGSAGAGTSTVNSGKTLDIAPTPSMPSLGLSETGLCGTVYYQIDVEWTSTFNGDHTGSSTEGNFACGASADADWSGLASLEGGTATVSWYVQENNGTMIQGESIQFTIFGDNPANPDVDGGASSPWFATHVLWWESGANAAGLYQQFGGPNGPGNPNISLSCKVLGCDGIGIGQLEPPNRKGDGDFWAWPVNVLHSLRLMDGNQGISYSNWTSEYNGMLTNTGNNPVPANWPSDCVTHANGAFCGGFGGGAVTFCSFSSSNPNGSPNGFGDGNWIHTYHGHFFVDWVDGTSTTKGHWEYDDQGNDNGYVYDVCTTYPQ